MAAPAKGGAKAAPAAKGGAKASSGLFKLYKISGNKLERTNKYCPKCGPGFFLGQHKDRVTCGKCHYTEFNRKN